MAPLNVAQGCLLIAFVRLGEGVSEKDIQLGKLYTVSTIHPCGGVLQPGGILNSIGIGKDGGYAEFAALDANLLVPVVCSLVPTIF